MSITLAAPPLQVTYNQMSSRSEKCSSKCIRPKAVTWPTADHMCQVCLFAVEDAPALLQLVSQDLLVAKKVKMMNASSVIDVHPSSESAPAKRAKFDMAAILAMDAQLSWKCPSSVLYHPSWLVTAGNDSSEVQIQQHREVRTLEAFYPRVSAIPASPIEPPTPESEVDNTALLEIPIVPLEDEDTANAGNARSANDSTSSRTLSALLPQIDSDPDVAAAAAAAFAVLKAQEKGSLIDCDLLVKILNNPLLTECLKNSEISVRRVSSSMKATGGITENAGGKGPSSLLNAQGRTYSSSDGKCFLQWQQRSRLQQPNGFNVGGTVNSQGEHEKERGILGNGQKVHRFNASVHQVCQGTSKLSFPSSQARCMPAIGTLRQSPVFHDSMVTGNILGPHCHPPFLENNFNVPLSRNVAGIRPKMPAGTKTRRPCLFVNTPKGCRNGVHCNFSHEPTVLQPFPTQCTKPPNATEDVQTTKGDDN